jgi:dipeptidyl aminopeptidase/acylaminoacyl peptidase
LVESSGGYLKAFDWSPDGKEVVFCDFSANSASTLWVLDIATGAKRLLSPKSSRRDFYDVAQFSRDGNGIYVITDHNSDFRRLAYIDLKSSELHFISPPGKSDVDEFQMSPNGERVAYLTNDDGTSKLWVLATKSGKVHFYQKVPRGVVSDLKWNSQSTELAFNLKSTSTPNDIYSVLLETGAVERWAQGVTNEISSTRFAKPELIHWRSSDKQIISGFMYRPPSTFKGKRPVIIDIHGGPEEQFKPAFNYTDNFFINELGIVKIYPNVRGSTGYGKAFLNSDNDAQREEAVKDIGALLDWIKTQPDLDGDRVLVEGASYGGYLALSVACAYGDRIRGAISDSGISNLASFVGHTEGWRRGLQRAEFGDERDPKIRLFLERIAPVNNAKKISKPLLIIQGQNDPRVPIGEAEQIVKATKDRVPVWYIVGKNEGHGFSQLENRNYQLYATILFVKQFLLK